MARVVRQRVRHSARPRSARHCRPRLRCPHSSDEEIDAELLFWSMNARRMSSAGKPPLLPTRLQPDQPTPASARRGDSDCRTAGCTTGNIHSRRHDV